MLITGCCKRMHFITRVTNCWKASSKQETLSDLYFRKVTHAEIKIDDSRIRLNLESPFKDLLQEAGSHRKWREEIQGILTRYSQTILCSLEYVFKYTEVSQVLQNQWRSMNIINKIILMQWIFKYLFLLKENIQNSTALILVLFIKP